MNLKALISWNLRIQGWLSKARRVCGYKDEEELIKDSK